jgi:hypothetical protein
MAVVALVSIALTPFLLEVAEAGGSSPELGSNNYFRIIDHASMAGAIIAGSLFVGVAAWHPRQIGETTTDKIQLTGTMVGLSFWSSSLMCFFVQLLNTSGQPKWGFLQYLMEPLSLSIFGAMGGALIFGPVAYLVGIAILWPLRRWERPLLVPANAITSDNARSLHRTITVLKTIMSVLPVLLAVPALLHLVGRLLVAGVAGLKTLF